MSEQDQPPAAETLVEIPPGIDVDFNFDVYVNGILQEYDSDYYLDGRTLVFPRRLAPEIKMTKFQFVRAALGVAGTYKKYDNIDITYERDGRKLVATGLRPRSPHRPPSG